MSRKPVTQGFRRVGVIWEVAASHVYEHQPELPYEVDWLLIIDGAIIFLDSEMRPLTRETQYYARESGLKFRRSGRPINAPLSYWTNPHNRPVMSRGPFWALEPHVNDALHAEFERNPTAYSKPRGAYWLRGYQQWTYSFGLAKASDMAQNIVEIPGLMRVVVTAGARRRKKLPAGNPEGLARLVFGSKEEANAFLDHINNLGSRGLSVSPFSNDYLPDVPRATPPSKLALYGYGCLVPIITILTLVVLGRVLGGNGSLAALATIGACAASIYFVHRWDARRKGSNGVSTKPSAEDE